MLLTTRTTAEEDICFNNIIQLNICEEADRVRDLVSDELPQNISQNLLKAQLVSLMSLFETLGVISNCFSMTV